jgi:hypothetical protein
VTSSRLCASGENTLPDAGVDESGVSYDLTDNATHLHAPCDLFVEAVERATTLRAAPYAVWIDPSTGLKLKRDRWLYWGEHVQGALEQIDWTWASPPPRTHHANHPSALAVAGQLGEQLDQAAALGMIEYPPTGMTAAEFAHNVLPLGAVVKPNGKVRMLVDPTLPGVNECMASLPCVLPSAESIFMKVNATSVLGKRDLDNGFFHVVLCSSARKHMAFTHPVTGKLARWVVLPQGTKQSPSIFCAVTEAAARIFNRVFTQQGIRATAHVYVDDFVFVADSPADMRKAFQATDEEADLLGLSWNLSKDVGRDGSATSLEALGLLFDAPSLTLSLPDDKRSQYASAIALFCDEHRTHNKCLRKPLEKLLGKLAYTCRVCRWGYLFLQAALDLLYPGFEQRSHHVYLNDAFWHDLTFWQRALDPTCAIWIGIHQHMIQTREIRVLSSDFSHQLYSDASKTYGVGGIVGPDMVFSQAWNCDVTEAHIGTLELEAVYRNLVHWQKDLHGQSVLVWVDNIQAMTAINKGASRIPALRDILLRIALLGVRRNFEVRAKYIPGPLNPADAPSRNKQATQDFVFLDLARFNNPPAQVDCSCNHPSIPALSSCENFSNPAAVSAAEERLAGKIIWATPPFCSLDRVLTTIVNAWARAPATTMATVVVPEWPTAVWYMRFIRRKRPLFQLVHRYPADALVFRFHGASRPVACAQPILVLRLGGPR